MKRIIKKPEGNRSKNTLVTPRGVLISRRFSAFERESCLRGILASARITQPGQSSLGHWHAMIQAKWRGHGQAMLKVKLGRMHDVFLYAIHHGYSIGSYRKERKSFQILRVRYSQQAVMGKGCFAAPGDELRRLLSDSQFWLSERRGEHGTANIDS